LSINLNLEKLSNACGITGREEQVRNLMVQLMTPYVDEIQVDKMENVIAIKKGKSKAPKIMLAAHMDEVGLMVKTITKDGFLQFSRWVASTTVFSSPKVGFIKGQFPAIGSNRRTSKEEERKKS
jgi:endoglucanase